MVKRLYRVRAVVTVYLMADDLADAEIEAGQAVEDEVRDNGADCDVIEVSPGWIVPPEWADSQPRGDDEEDRTVGEILADIEAEERARRLAAPAPGQTSFLDDAPTPSAKGA